MGVQRWEESGFEQLSASISRQAVHGEAMTVARIRLRRGTLVEQHEHVNEQVATVFRGRMKFVLGEEEHVVSAGESIVLPPNVPHAAEALEDSDVLDVFSPARDDWRRGEDAYLRR